MADSFTLKVFTPAGLLVEAVVTSVSLPTSQGEVGILPQHVNYVALLGTGILQYAMASGQSAKLVIAGGFCSFSDEHLTVLADAVDAPENVDRSTYGAERANLQKVLQGGDSSDPQWAVAQQKLARIEALDQLVMH